MNRTWPVGQAWRQGWVLVFSAPLIIAFVFVLTFALAIPLALSIRAALERDLGVSLAAAEAAEHVNYDWWQEFAADASGLETTFTPAIIGFASTLDSLSGLADGEPEVAEIGLVLGVYLMIWTFAVGGILERYSRAADASGPPFMVAAGRVFVQLLRLAVLAAAIYGLLFAYVHGWMFDDGYGRLVREVAVEHRAFAFRLLLYIGFALLLAAVNIVFDYAKIAAVVQGPQNAVRPLRTAVSFIWSHRASALSLYGVNALMWGVLLAAWALSAPGAGGGGRWMWLAFVGTQAYVLVRLLLKLHFLASQTALFQGLRARQSVGQASHETERQVWANLWQGMRVAQKESARPRADPVPARPHVLAGRVLRDGW